MFLSEVAPQRVFDASTGFVEAMYADLTEGIMAECHNLQVSVLVESHIAWLLEQDAQANAQPAQQPQANAQPAQQPQANAQPAQQPQANAQPAQQQGSAPASGSSNASNDPGFLTKVKNFITGVVEKITGFFKSIFSRLTGNKSVVQNSLDQAEKTVQAVQAAESESPGTKEEFQKRVDENLQNKEAVSKESANAIKQKVSELASVDLNKIVEDLSNDNEESMKKLEAVLADIEKIAKGNEQYAVGKMTAEEYLVVLRSIVSTADESEKQLSKMQQFWTNWLKKFPTKTDIRQKFPKLSGLISKSLAAVKNFFGSIVGIKKKTVDATSAIIEAGESVTNNNQQQPDQTQAQTGGQAPAPASDQTQAQAPAAAQAPAPAPAGGQAPPAQPAPAAAQAFFSNRRKLSGIFL